MRRRLTKEKPTTMDSDRLPEVAGSTADPRRSSGPAKHAKAPSAWAETTAATPPPTYLFASATPPTHADAKRSLDLRDKQKLRCIWLAPDEGGQLSQVYWRQCVSADCFFTLLVSGDQQIASRFGYGTMGKIKRTDTLSVQLERSGRFMDAMHTYEQSAKMLLLKKAEELTARDGLQYCKKHVQRAAVYQSMANYFKKQKKFQAALQAAEKAVRINEKLAPQDRIPIAYFLQACLHGLLQEPSKAGFMYTTCLAVAEAQRPSHEAASAPGGAREDPQVAEIFNTLKAATLHNLAIEWANLNMPEQTRDALASAMEVGVHYLPQTHPVVVRILETYKVMRENFLFHNSRNPTAPSEIHPQTTGRPGASVQLASPYSIEAGTTRPLPPKAPRILNEMATERSSPRAKRVSVHEVQSPETSDLAGIVMQPLALARRHALQRKAQAATRMQSAVRMYLQKACYELIRGRIRRTQAVWRGGLARSQKKVSLASVVQIQCAWRSRNERVKYAFKKVRLVLLQAVVRGFIARAEWARRGEAATAIQAQIRRHLCSNDLKRSLSAAATINRVLRGMQARERVSSAVNKIVGTALESMVSMVVAQQAELDDRKVADAVVKVLEAVVGAIPSELASIDAAQNEHLEGDADEASAVPTGQDQPADGSEPEVTQSTINEPPIIQRIGGPCPSSLWKSDSDRSILVAMMNSTITKFLDACISDAIDDCSDDQFFQTTHLPIHEGVVFDSSVADTVYPVCGTTVPLVDTEIKTEMADVVSEVARPTESESETESKAEVASAPASDSDSDVTAVAVDVATVDAAEVDSTEVATAEKESVVVVETEVESVVAALVSELSSGSEVGEFDVGDSSVAPAEVAPAEEVEEAVQVLVDNVSIEVSAVEVAAVEVAAIAIAAAVDSVVAPMVIAEVEAVMADVVSEV
ncbi:hypothetical protein BBJ28_00002361, partial [Nothophytophthora sp. Chile5]